MTDQAVFLSLNVLLWIFLLYRFINARQRRKIHSRSSAIAWGMFSAIYFFLLLSVDPIEAAIDTPFGGAPVTTLLRSLLMLGALHVYLLAVRRDLINSPARERIFLRLNPITAVIILALFGWAVSTRLIPHDALALLVKGVRDITVTAWCVFILLPLHLRWFRVERVRPMKLMYGMNLACYTALLVQSVSTVGIALGSFMTLVMAGKLVHPAIVIGYLILVLLTLWSRIETRNHSVLQVAMGALGGILPVLLVFPLVL